MTAQQLAADQFWVWFRQHSSLLAQLSQKDNSTFAYWLSELHARLRVYSHQYLYAEMDWPAGGGVCRLIISAGGALSHFPQVEGLVKRAPALPGWQVVAFQPPQSSVAVIRQRFGDTGIDPHDLWFCPMDLKHTLINNKPFLTVYAKVQTPVTTQFNRAVKAVLMSLLGERVAVLELAGVRVKGYKGVTPCPGKQVLNLRALPSLLPCLDQVGLAVNERGELESGIRLD